MAAASGAKLFEKNLTEVDIQSGLVLGMDSSIHPPTLYEENSCVDFNVVDEEGKVWHFRGFTGGRIGGLATKSVILGGWGEFVRHHNLRVKDKVNFYDNQGERNEVSFVIHVRRTIRLFGVDITQAD